MISDSSQSLLPSPVSSLPPAAGQVMQGRATVREAIEGDDIGAPPPVPRPRLVAWLGLAIAAAAVLTGLFLVGWIPLARRQTALAAEAETIKTSLPHVQLVHPRRSPAVVTALLPGDVEALEETSVYSRTNGYLKRWLVDIGDEMQAGQLLVEIDTPEIDQELQQAKATLGQLRARLLTAQANLRLAHITLDRYEKLLATKTITGQEFDERQATYATASSTVEAAKADVEAGEASVQRLTETQAFSKIYAPFAGIITTRTIEVGRLVSASNGASQSLYRLAKTDTVRVFVNVPQIYSHGVNVGLQAELVVREMPGRKFIGKITRTARAIDPVTRTLRTEIQVPNKDHALLTGSYVQVRLEVARENPPLLIPASALTFDADGTRVALVDAEHHIHFQRVIVEGDFGSDVGISDGLTPDALTVINPGQRLAEGGLVEVDGPAVQ
jgi:membrane fusion protein, multidrug efflux system